MNLPARMIAIAAALASPAPAADVVKVPAYDQFVVIPLRVHVLTSKGLDLVNGKITDAEAAQVVPKINAIWAKAGIAFGLDSVVREPASQVDRFKATLEVNHGQVAEDLGPFAYLMPASSRVFDGLHLYLFAQLPLNGEYLGGADAAIVREQPELNEVKGGSKEWLARVAARGLGQALGLPGRPDQLGLLSAGTNGVGLNESEIGRARQVARTIPGALGVADAAEEAEAASKRGDLTRARKLWACLAEVPGTARPRRRRSSRPSPPPSPDLPMTAVPVGQGSPCRCHGRTAGRALPYGNGPGIGRRDPAKPSSPSRSTDDDGPGRSPARRSPSSAALLSGQEVSRAAKDLVTDRDLACLAAWLGPVGPVPRRPQGPPPRPSDGRGPGLPATIPSPPSILGQEVRPIDLNTALRLAGVENPELNLARQRVVEAAAFRQFAAAQILPTLNFGTNYDSHTGALQQSNGNILSVNRSAVYVGAGANAVAAGTVNIPGVFLGGNIGQGIFAYLTTRQVVVQRRVRLAGDPEPGLPPGGPGLLRADPRRGHPGRLAPGPRRGPRGRPAHGRLRGDRPGTPGRRRPGGHRAGPPRGRGPGRRGADPDRLGRALPGPQPRPLDPPAPDRRLRRPAADRARPAAALRADRPGAAPPARAGRAPGRDPRGAAGAGRGRRSCRSRPRSWSASAPAASAAGATWSGRSSAA